MKKSEYDFGGNDTLCKNRMLNSFCGTREYGLTNNINQTDYSYNVIRVAISTIKGTSKKDSYNILFSCRHFVHMT